MRFTRQADLLSESDRQVTVLCDQPATVGQPLELEVVESETNRSRRHALRVASSRPVLLDGGLRHELRLTIVGLDRGTSGSEAGE